MAACRHMCVRCAQSSNAAALAPIPRSDGFVRRTPRRGDSRTCVRSTIVRPQSAAYAARRLSTNDCRGAVHGGEAARRERATSSASVARSRAIRYARCAACSVAAASRRARDCCSSLRARSTRSSCGSRSTPSSSTANGVSSASPRTCSRGARPGRSGRARCSSSRPARPQASASAADTCFDWR